MSGRPHDPVTIETARGEPDTVAMLCEASADPSICAATYLPAGMGPDDVRNWLAGREGDAWVIRLDGKPVGWIEVASVRDSCGVSVPAGTVEREVWLLPEARGKRVSTEATRLLAPHLRARGVEHVLDVIWETNAPALRAAARGGFERIGRGWWEHEGEAPGWCEVWLLRLP